VLEELGVANEVRQELVARSSDIPVESGMIEYLGRVVRHEVNAAMRTKANGIEKFDEERWVSVKVAAKVAEISEETIRRWIQKEKLKANKPGREYRIRLSDLEACMEQNDGQKPRVDIEGEAARILQMSNRRRK